MTKSKRMPVLFIGHGSPMNAIQSNTFTDSLKALSTKIERPTAILCISAHWMTKGTWVTRMANPQTIHDFHGFPDELNAVQYPAPGSPETAEWIRSHINEPSIDADDGEWGLDHGTWSLLRHMYPEADVPVLQLSLAIEEPGPFHLRLGEKLRDLRDRGVLILGSGNIVHNLRKIVWDSEANTYTWAKEFDAWSKAKIEARDFESLAKDFAKTEAGRLSVPTPEHYYPLLYALGASHAEDAIAFEFEGMQNGSISMRSVSFGLG